MITSISEDMAYRKVNLQEYELVMRKINGFVDNINNKIVNRIEKVKQGYLEDYKQQVSLMAAQLKSIRAVLDEEQLKQRSNQRLFHLEEQRDFFRAQVIKLNEQLRVAKSEISTLKTSLSQSQHQCSNYRTIAYELQTKIYKLTYENIEMEKIKEDDANMPTTMANTSIKNGFMNGSHRQAKAVHQANQNTLTHSQFERQNRGKPGLQKTQYSLRKLKPSRSMGGGGSTTNFQKLKIDLQPSKKQQILNNCIKEVKKEIFYRNLSSKESAKIHFDESDKVSFDKFTKSDKRELVYKFMSNPEILDDLYRLVFSKKQQKDSIDQNRGDLDKLMIAKGSDAKYNTKMLLSFKTEFDKKIYDIKANRY